MDGYKYFEIFGYDRMSEQEIPASISDEESSYRKLTDWEGQR